MAIVKALIDNALVAIAATKNHQYGNAAATDRIAQLYSELKACKRSHVEDTQGNRDHIENLLKEALQLKHVPIDEFQKRMRDFALAYTCIPAQKPIEAGR